ncbi:hypothetical protein AB0K02_27910 [Streptomyces sp. NPDC049597]|uniref:hypothetical protein n=1 Tax=Streptomyces sp. NPDC049597 TaxID=3155276 RepID=UPI003439F4C6
MMVVVDPPDPAAALRRRLFQGDIVVLTGLPGVRALAEHTREQLTDLFAPHDPQRAHEHYSPSELAGMLGRWKPRFIHSRRAGELVREIIVQAGFPAGRSFYDVPKPRTSFPQGHLTTGVAFSFPWHRDVWYGAPAQQVNWWLPVFDVLPDNAMYFDPAFFAREVPNDSETFDYYRHNAGRAHTARQVTHETQPRPRALDHTADHPLTVLPSTGAVMLFSGAHLHATVPNTSGWARYSVDFRTVDSDDLHSGSGAPLVDVRCTGTAIRDFHNVATHKALSERTVVELFGRPPADAVLVYDPELEGDTTAGRG